MHDIAKSKTLGLAARASTLLELDPAPASAAAPDQTSRSPRRPRPGTSAHAPHPDATGLRTNQCRR